MRLRGRCALRGKMFSSAPIASSCTSSAGSVTSAASGTAACRMARLLQHLARPSGGCRHRAGQIVRAARNLGGERLQGQAGRPGREESESPQRHGTFVTIVRPSCPSGRLCAVLPVPPDPCPSCPSRHRPLPTAALPTAFLSAGCVGMSGPRPARAEGIDRCSDASIWATCSGVPVATITPPSSPPSGPRSIR